LFGAQGGKLPCLFLKVRGLQYPKQMQYDEDDRDDNQRVNEVAGFGDSGIYPWTEKAEQPQHD
jgi:hypothetical protein